MARQTNYLRIREDKLFSGKNSENFNSLIVEKTIPEKNKHENKHDGEFEDLWKA